MRHIYLITILLLSLNTFSQENDNITNISFENKLWRDAGYPNAVVSFLDTNKFYDVGTYPKFTHYIDLNMILLHNAGWEGKEQITRLIMRVARIYGKYCGIKVRNAKYIEADAPLGKVDIDYDKNEDLILTDRVPTKERPLIFFIRSSNDASLAYSWPKITENLPKSLVNTIFATPPIDTEEFIQQHRFGYSVLAHELAHLLSNQREHIYQKKSNILTDDFDWRSSSITPEQCECFRSNSDLVKPYKD